MQKRQIPEKGFALIKTISQPIETLSKYGIHSSKHNFRACLCTPTYCVCHNNKKVQNNSDSLQSKRANKSED